MTKASDRIRLFALNNLAIEAAVQRVEREKDIDLGHRPLETGGLDETYYPQFEEKIRREAGEMAVHYRVFYCLENSIRSLITSIMAEQHGMEWWAVKAPQNVRENVERIRLKEIEHAVAARSEDPLDYTTFGELGEIIKQNWNDFTDVFQNRKALERVIATLNVLRGPIAHCKPLAEDEVVRLHLSVRDWFRSMGS
jgi:hypothetical protein